MNEAIRIAVSKGDYNPSQYVEPGHYNTGNISEGARALIVLDPLFWQALGKVLGWKEGYYCPFCKEYSEPQGPFHRCDCTEPMFLNRDWLNQALRYHELNLTGGDTEKFWKELLLQPTH